jgi:hypothetical protein
MKWKITQINAWINSKRMKTNSEWNKEENIGYERIKYQTYRNPDNNKLKFWKCKAQ